MGSLAGCSAPQKFFSDGTGRALRLGCRREPQVLSRPLYLAAARFGNNSLARCPQRFATVAGINWNL